MNKKDIQREMQKDIEYLLMEAIGLLLRDEGYGTDLPEEYKNIAKKYNIDISYLD